MKTKTKLIATIVSICAAIAVMGIGVFASTQTYSVSVTNTVNLDFANITGTINVEANAYGYDTTGSGPYTHTATGTAQSLSTATIFNSGNASNTWKTSISSSTGEGMLQYLGADAFDYDSENTVLTSDTKTAVSYYHFTYTPIEGNIGYVGFNIAEQNAPELDSNQSAASIELEARYYFKVGSEYVQMDTTANKYYFAAPTATIEIYCVILYKNLDGFSIKLEDDSWEFTINALAMSSSEVGNTPTVATGKVTNLNTCTGALGTSTEYYSFPTTSGSATNIFTKTVTA